MYTYTYDPYYQTLIKKDAASGRHCGSLSIPLQDLYDVMKAIEKHVEKVDTKVNQCIIKSSLTRDIHSPP